jgi:stage II sporulation protein AB (anti-sigma F factor)
MRPHPGPYLIKSYPAVPASVPRGRHTLTEFAEAAGATREQLDEIKLAASEALSNVVLHAYGEERRGRIYMTAAVAAGELWVLIADDGRGLQPHGETAGLGVGLALIANASDELALVSRASGGTEVRMRFELGSGEPEPSAQPRGSLASAISPA